MQKSQNTGIETLALSIELPDLRELRRDIWCDDPVPASLKVGDMKYEIDIAYRGAHTRKFPKKSFHISFYKPKTLWGSREFHLNAEYNDPSLMRNKLSFDFFSSLGAVAPDAKHVQLMLNEDYAGLYLKLESVDDLFLVRRGLPIGDIFYAIDDDANFSLISPFDNKPKKTLHSGYEQKVGTSTNHLEKLIYKINTTPRADFGNEILKYISVDKYLLWLAGAVCTQNYDGFIHNYALYFNPKTSLFEIIPWDYDATWGRDCNGNIMEYNYVPIEGYNTLTARLLDVYSFRRMYLNLMEMILERHFTRTALETKIIDLHQLIRPHVMNDPNYRKQLIARFDREPELICKFISDRNRYLKDQIMKLRGR